MSQDVALRALNADGTLQVVGAEPLRLPLADQDPRQAQAVLPPVEALLGAPVVLLGTAGVDELEVEVQGDRLSPGLRWAEVDPADTRADRVPWARPGWYEQTCAAVDEVLSDLGRPRTGPARQVVHWGISAVMEIPTAEGAVWFKQVPALFAHEGRLTAFLHDVVPGSVPHPLHVGEDWWLTEAIPAQLRPLVGMEHYTPLGVLQRAVADCTEQLLGLGCPDRRLGSLMASLLSGRTTALLTPDQADRLRAGRDEISAAVSTLMGSGLPDTLVHGDFHTGNLRLTARGWVIYDWTDGSVSHPLLDLQPLWSLRRWTGEEFEQGVASWWPGRTIAPEVWAAATKVGMANLVVSHTDITLAVEPLARAMWEQETRRWCDELLKLLASD